MRVVLDEDAADLKPGVVLDIIEELRKAALEVVERGLSKTDIARKPGQQIVLEPSVAMTMCDPL